jgi:hypothetical protein
MILDSFQLKGKNALVTGSSRGLGAAIAIALAEAGANVGCHGRSAGGRDTSEAIRELGRTSFYLAGDIVNPDLGWTLLRKMIDGISTVVMTNDPLDPEEQRVWMSDSSVPPQYQAVIRLDGIVRYWSTHWQGLVKHGYEVDEQASGKSIVEVRRFLRDWHKRMNPVYMAVSLPNMFQFPDDSVRTKILKDAVLPSRRGLGLPLSLMIGVRNQVNPRIRLGGDAVGRADLRAVENLCRSFPDNRFLISVLSRENQHELCVYARKFNNLMPFGCWWFLNNPSIVEEITRERVEMLGTSFIPQHSDARVLEQVIYQWRNTRATMTSVLANSYRLLARDGRGITRQMIQRDVEKLFRCNFEKWVSPACRTSPVG